MNNIRKKIFVMVAIVAIFAASFIMPETAIRAQASASNFTVAIDAGHGGGDGGASRPGSMTESQINLKIAQYCKAYLEANSDINVYMTRSTDTYISVSDRPKLAKAAGADLVVSMHINASEKTSPSGVGVYIPHAFYNTEMKQFASYIVNNNKAIGLGVWGDGLFIWKSENETIYKLDANGLPVDRLIKGTDEYNSYTGTKILADYLGIIGGSTQRQMPSVLIEHGFISNASDRAFINKEANIKAMGEADAKAIITYYNSLDNDAESTFDTTTTNPYVAYQPFCQSYGLRNWRYEGETAGTLGKSKRLEALTVKIPNAPSGATLVANAYVEGTGWQKNTVAAATGTTLGTTGQSNRMESIKLDIQNIPGYSIQYRAYVQGYGWKDWVENGVATGVAGSGKRIEAIQIKLVKKNSMSSVGTNLGVAYQTQVQTYGWQNWVANGGTAGTTGESKRMEAVKISLLNAPAGAYISAKAHIQTYGWRNYNLGTGGTIGTQGESKRLEAICLTLNGVEGYSLEYRAHVQSVGWTKWVSQGQIAGTSGLGKRIEAIEIRVVTTSNLSSVPYVTYKSHVQTYGWLDWVSEYSLSGTSGESKRMEAIYLDLHNAAPGMYISGKVHCQTYGWKTYNNITSDTLLGTSGESKRVESINFKLNGTDKYKLQYRVHVQTYGWTDWIDQGKNAGTEGQGKRLEAVEFRIVEK